MLPKCVLSFSVRGGKGKRRKSDNLVKEKCRAWLEGSRSSLWSRQRRQERKAFKGPEDVSQWQERAVDFVKESLFQKACSMLVSKPPVEVTPEVVLEMRAKHPVARESDSIDLRTFRRVHSSVVMEADEEEVCRAIKSFKKGSGGGASGLRPQHIKDALTPSTSDVVVSNIAAVVSILSQGGAPEAVQEWVCGASLAALPKSSGGLRPIAVGETWRRLTAKILASRATQDLREHLEPFQMGVGTKSACETIIHVCRQWLGRNRDDPNKVLVKVDISNAFNSIDRYAVLSNIRRVVPYLAPWCDFCYTGSSKLLLGSSVLSSARGVQQGDPLGPALFSVAIHDTIKRVARQAEDAYSGEIDLKVFYLDDGIIGGTGRAVRLFCDALRTEFAEIGLDMCFDKCEVIPAAGANHTVDTQAFSDFIWNDSQCFSLLGAPIGHQDFCTQVVQQKVEEAVALLQECIRVQHSQCALLLVRYCASYSKLVYLMRTVPSSLCSHSFSTFSARMRTELSKLMACELSDWSWEQAQLSIKKGGLGLRSVEEHAAGAYLSSILGCQEMARLIDPSFDIADSSHASLLSDALDDVRARVLLPDTINTDVAHSQKHYSALIDAQKVESKMSNPIVPIPFKMHLKLVSKPGAGAWLTAPPASDGREISAQLFQICLQRRLRCKTSSADVWCPACGDPLDQFSDHALTCSCKGNRTVRHNVIRNVVYESCSLAGMAPIKEKPNLLPSRPGEDGISFSGRGRRPADIWIPAQSGSEPEAWDFACTSGLRVGGLSSGVDGLDFIFSDYEEQKRQYQQTDSQCRAAGFSFIPLVLEAHGGGFSDALRGKLEGIADRIAASTSAPKGMVSLNIAQRISCALQRENARARC
jgi:hypothetical protein